MLVLVAPVEVSRMDLEDQATEARVDCHSPEIKQSHAVPGWAFHFYFASMELALTHELLDRGLQ